jgi:hypothetical protein
MKAAMRYIAVKKCVCINAQKATLSIESFCCLKMMNIVEKVLKKLQSWWRLRMTYTDKKTEVMAASLCQERIV